MGFILGSLSGIDVRRQGSGNVGATNVARVVGRRQGIVTLVGDAAKGYIPVFFASWLGFDVWVADLAGAAAFVGHLYPVFLKFSGGKGVATALGILLALAPAATGALALIFLIIALWTRLVSLASVAAALLAPLLLWAFSSPQPTVGLGFFLALMIVVRHRENIQRLASGAEPKFRL